jgi:2-oxoglutarate dehydrogenase E1 component
MFRRQVQRKWRKPLIVMSPKSLLRHPKAVSTLEDLEKNQFQRILPDSKPDRSGVTRVLWCTGKIYYELAQKREELEREDVAVLRIEQLYPLPDNYIIDAMSAYADGTECMFVQDEPENMGAWRHMRARFGDSVLGRWPFSGVTRRASSSPATGSAAAHKIEQARLLDRAFA